jgi:hypothetical protein
MEFAMQKTKKKEAAPPKTLLKTPSLMLATRKKDVNKKERKKTLHEKASS